MLLHRIKDKNKEKRDSKTIRICKSSKSNNYGKHFLKKNVLTKPLKLVKELAKRILLGIEFHSLGAATWKALSPVFDFVGRTANRF